jgi:kinesin family protein 4/21/27
MTAAIQDELLTAVRAELADSQEAVATHVNNLAELQASYDALQSSLQSTVDESTESKEALERQLTDHRETIAMHVATLKELQEIQDQREIELEKLREKEKKHAKLVEDLEQELTFTFDQNQESANTLASITKDYEKAKQERDDLAATSEQKAVESQKVFESLNEEIVKLRVLYCSE